MCFQKISKAGSESVGCNNLLDVGFSQSDCRADCAKMIIIDELSFRFVEHEVLRYFVVLPALDLFFLHALQLIGTYWSCTVMRRKNWGITLLNTQWASLTIDTWTSIQNVYYMILTSQFIDTEWRMQKRILNFCQIANHKGETIGKAIEAWLKDWQIDKMSAITVDNAASNSVDIVHIKILQIWKTAICDGNFLHMRCSAHILN